MDNEKNKNNDRPAGNAGPVTRKKIAAWLTDLAARAAGGEDLEPIAGDLETLTTELRFLKTGFNELAGAFNVRFFEPPCKPR